MNTEKENNITATASKLDILIEPFLLTGVAFFWALALPLAATTFGLRAALIFASEYVESREPSLILSRRRALA